MYKILLYYKYAPVENPAELVKSQKELCKRLGLKGRILISDEGINGTIAGLKENADEYTRETSKIKGFEDIHWKVSYAEEQVFPRLRVAEREEIVTLGERRKGKDVKLKNGADYIEPEDLRKLYESGEEFFIIDARNEYEARIGKFKNAITFDVDNFRDIPEKTAEIEKYKDKKVITYCTGGIRCEKYSAYLKENGFSNVQQLHGGIHRYSEEAGGKFFEGEMYVFDGRVHVPVNFVDPNVISQCIHCEEKVSRFINCRNKSCNKKIIMCERCDKEYEGCCNEECKATWRDHVKAKVVQVEECGCM